MDLRMTRETTKVSPASLSIDKISRRKEKCVSNTTTKLSLSATTAPRGEVATAPTTASPAPGLEIQVPDVYRFAQNYRWDLVATESKGLDFIHPTDGTTALHLAVMSRTAYNRVILNHPPQSLASIQLIELLLNKYPDAAKVKCAMNTYTPLAYACLVVEGPNPAHQLAQLEPIVRLLLRHCPESTKIFTSGGLGPLDVHIVSYSQIQNEYQDAALEHPANLTGRTDMTILRTLLEHDSSLAEVRILDGDKVSGPIELLYRSNAKEFLRFTKEGGNILSKVSKWWVWKWMVLILKYGTRKERGARFMGLHAASIVVGCPVPILTLAMAAFPKQISSGGDTLPLHRVCAWHCQWDCTSSDPMIPSRKAVAMFKLLQQYPEAASKRSENGELPLELAVSSGTTWDTGVRKLCRAYPGALTHQSSRTGLYPFMTAAVAAGETARNQSPLPSAKKRRSLMTHLKNLTKQDTQSVRTIYGLLRANPTVLANCFPEILMNRNSRETGASAGIARELWGSKINQDGFSEICD